MAQFQSLFYGLFKKEIVFVCLGQINKHLGTADLAFVEDDSTLDINVLFCALPPVIKKEGCILLASQHTFCFSDMPGWSLG